MRVSLLLLNALKVAGYFFRYADDGICVAVNILYLMESKVLKHWQYDINSNLMFTTAFICLPMCLCISGCFSL